MASLLAKDAYLQSLARKICSRPSPEPHQRKSVGKTQGSDTAGPPKKKRKRAQKKPREQGEKAVESKARAQGEKPRAASQARKPLAAKQERPSGSPGVPADGPAREPDSLFALDVLRQRLHEKIQEARGQGRTQELSPAALEKRQRRRQERDRKKRKRRELRAREQAARAAGPVEAAEPGQEAQGRPAGLLFNKVEVEAEAAAAGGRAQRRKEKRRRLKGRPAPLTGRNYRQLLERLAARRERLAALRERDAGGARALESRLRWAAALHRAEGVRVRDDERQLQAALRRKERRRAQRRRRWERRAALVVGKMQRRQERRRQNLRRKKAAKAERRREEARRKGRVLPQDLERAGLA